MKRCNQCSTVLEDETKFCTNCGSSDLLGQEAPVAEVPAAEIPQAESGNVVAGIVGAILFSLLGGVLYFIIYQMGIIAGISGLITFVLASFGYDLFSRTKNSIVGMVISAVAALAALYAAEYLCISFEIYRVYQELGITFFDAVQATSEFLKDPEISSAFWEDLIFAYIFGGIAIISNIVTALKAKKKAQ